MQDQIGFTQVAMKGLIGLVVSLVGFAGIATAQPGRQVTAEDDPWVAVIQQAAENLNGAAMVYAIESADRITGGNVRGVDGTVLYSDTPLRIASNTKTFVAVAALRLVETEVLELDIPIRDQLPAVYVTLLDDAGYDVDAITLRLLLMHLSGIPDHAQLRSYFDAILDDPTRVWTREDQVRLAMTEGQPVGAPGERFSYSDTGYVLAGAIIEEATGESLATTVRRLAIEPTRGLLDTWWETFEAAPETAESLGAQQAFGGPLARIHPSVDLYGGGGLVSTVDDLLYFHKSAAQGQLLSTRVLRRTLTTPSMESVVAGSPYGMGFFIRDYAGETCLEHPGFWGTIAVYCPDSDVAVAAAVSDAQAGFGALRPLIEAAVEYYR